ncbi:MAG: hypothetical protein R3E86_17510 [Pseudomonadales bacterium]
MLPRLSLLDELRKGGYEASLITTFNAYLPFYEEVVLRRLINAGVRHNVLLMDAQQYSVSLQNHPPRLAGRSYTLAPIAVPGAFHPKLIFLAGKQKGLVVVGSHNMTLAGFGFNRELTNVIRIGATGDEAGIAVAAHAWSEIFHWIDSSSEKLPQPIRDMVARVKDFAPWLSAEAPGSDSEVQLLAGRAGAQPLWEQLRSLITAPAKEIFLTGAFFDAKLTFLNQINTDLQPERLVVALDPATVEIPPDTKGVSGVRFVRAENLGTDDEKDVAIGYLHAKGVFLRLQNNDCVFVSGSANPSRPAWLANKGDGNTELMVARLGASAESAASELGFAEIPNLPPLDDNDWQTIANNRSRVDSEPTSGPKVGVAVVVDDEVHIDVGLAIGLQSATLILLDAERREIAQGIGLIEADDQYVATFAREALAQARFLRCALDKQTAADLLLHHARIVEEQARTGVQKRFKDALLSLQTDTPNIGLLIECLDKIVFSDDASRSPVPPGHASSPPPTVSEEDSETDSLAIDVSDVSRRKSKHRLTHNSDLGYLLDTLIFHLRFHEDRTMETVDRLGRSEEEQVGADDSEDAGEAHLTEDDRAELLTLCHAKVRTVVRRMIKQLTAYTEGKQALDAVLFRLLGVLAVLRELRSCDGRVQWVDQGKTTVPCEERVRLFEEVMFSLFEGKTSLLHMEALGEELAASEDVARLKGLLLWLAWDCGLLFDLDKPFMETPEKQAARLKTNAMLLALAQSVQADEQVTEEAQQSIGIFTTSDMDWLNVVRGLATQCDAAKRGELAARSADEAEPGDVAIHRNIQNWDLRVVAGARGNAVSLIKLTRAKERVDYMPEHLLTTKLYPDRPAALSG